LATLIDLKADLEGSKDLRDLPLERSNTNKIRNTNNARTIIRNTNQKLTKVTSWSQSLCHTSSYGCEKLITLRMECMQAVWHVSVSHLSTNRVALSHTIDQSCCLVSHFGPIVLLCSGRSRPFVLLCPALLTNRAALPRTFDQSCCSVPDALDQSCCSVLHFRPIVSIFATPFFELECIALHRNIFYPGARRM